MLGKVFVARPIFPETIEELKRHTDVLVNADDRVLSKSELMRNLEDVDGVLTLVTDTVDREVLNAAPRLKVVANFGVGVNNVDLDAATELGITVTNTPGVLTETTADLGGHC
jgi:glyoxylate reductase